MTRINLVDPRNVTDERKTTFEEIRGAFGVVPNMFRAVANSNGALQSMWGSFGALGAGTLGSKLGEQIAVAVADLNHCEYCLSAHTSLGTRAGASVEEMGEAQRGRSEDPRTAAALTLATTLVQKHGQLADIDLDAARSAGLNDAAIVEVVAHVALNLFTNYINVALQVPLDFKAVQLTS